MTLAPVREVSSQVLPDPTELLIKEAHQRARRRRLRWTSLFIVLAVTASLLVVSGVGRSKPAALAQDTNSNSRGSSALVTMCTATNVRITDRGTDVGAGSWLQLFQLKNVSDHACSVTGYPKIALETSRGPSRSLVVTSIKYEAGRYIGDSLKSAPPSSNLAAHGGVATFWIAGSDTPAVNQPGCELATEVLVTLPGAKKTLAYNPTRIPFNVCENEIDVTPVLPGRSGSIPAEPLSYYDLMR